MSRRRQRPAPIAIDLAPRLPIVDLLRGVAVAMMIAYHFCYDLSWFGWADFHMLSDARWIAWRTVIVASFLTLVGVSLVLAQRQTWRGYRRRLLQIAGCALAVSLASAYQFGERFIYFGILHFIVVATALGRLMMPMGLSVGFAGGAIIAFGYVFQSAAMNPRYLNWIGLAAEKPTTEDYVPLLPWLGVVLLGCAAAELWRRCDFRVTPFWGKLADRTPRWLFWLGRHSLLVYMLHQPIMLFAIKIYSDMVAPNFKAVV